jgi:glutathione S-transferase
VNLRDVYDSLRRRPAGGGGSGACRTTTGEVLELELYKFDSCPYCQHVFRVVERLGVPVRYRDILRDDAAARSLVEIGGRDQVPCLVIDGRPLYESAAIAEFLERRFGDGAGL